MKSSGMIRIEKEAWNTMVAHARATYPNECCGTMLGSIDDGGKNVHLAIELENSIDGEQYERYQLRNEDLRAARDEARRRGMDLIGIFHSHPDRDAYFSETDLKNSCPWYSFVVLSFKQGQFDHANSFLPNADQTAAESEEMSHPS